VVESSGFAAASPSLCKKGSPSVASWRFKRPCNRSAWRDPKPVSQAERLTT
jgi:hypothetical protein